MEQLKIFSFEQNEIIQVNQGEVIKARKKLKLIRSLYKRLL